MNKNLLVLYSTVGTKKQAEKLATIALSARKASCVNILPAGKSIYLWENKIEQNDEFYLLFKTSPELVNELEQLIIENHPYDLPAILKFDVEGSQEFVNYILSSLKS
jgi:periplasmic divalent cation tolerance protein